MIKKFILFLLLISLTNSCSFHFNLKKNSVWTYNDGIDSMKVYIHKDNFFTGIIVKDHIDLDSAKNVGRAKRKHLNTVKTYPSPKY